MIKGKQVESKSIETTNKTRVIFNKVIVKEDSTME